MNVFIIRYLYIILSIFSLCTSCGWESDYKEAAKRSLQPNTDLILVPYPFNIFDKHSRESITLSHYTQDEIKNILKEYDLSWDELKDSWKWNEKEQSFEKEVNYTSHYTQYSYDTNIPVWIYGPKWFYNGNYADKIHQQHLASILSKVLDFSFSNLLDVQFLTKIFKTNSEKPKLIITIVVDQGGQQLYSAHPNAFPFLKDLKSKSAYFKNGKVGHLEAHTAVGHAAIGTGAYPSQTQAFSNEIYSWSKGKIDVHQVYQGLGDTIDLNELKAASLADEWDLYLNNEPVVISQCYAARASIGMAGHGKDFHSKSGQVSDSDFVYWENTKDLKWDTYSNAYLVPDALKRFNLYDFYKEKEKTTTSSFKVKDRLEFLQKIHFFQASEYQVLLDGESIRTAIQKEILEKKKHLDGKTDFVYVTLKATDAVGHLSGWESEEARKILSATDKEIETIFNFLKENYGDDFILVVTADHGAAPMPEVSNASFLTHDQFFEELSRFLPKEVRTEKSIVQWVTHSQLSLNREVMKEYSITEDQVIEKLENILVDGKPFFRRIWKRSDL
ncbi:alkaline phosphatase family protein [Leptospira ilyithenensis]|uniref:Type I phosphodiesterase/nucleotide pyrophosphatase n=1 Tax=Leptospira ilyithenensis TaxID=2484901 RepID=A0A4R9LRI7_9LEPT|nr:alkaline phosphatase family protein [Leptospira ilyithenensis]TGN10992.1 type I phosphodiesterase/nucleotide pyrophosphatase [Leptospira ilyithenensis]